MSDVLRLEAVSKTYGKGGPAPVEALRPIDLSVARGEVVALVAPSGAGKSTLLHIAGLLDTPDGGKVWLNGRDMTGLPDRARTEARRRELGFVYQFHHLLPEFSAAENIVLPQLADGRAARDAAARAEGSDTVSRFLQGRTGRKTAQTLGENAEHENYYLATVYTIDMNGRMPGGEQRYLGIAGWFTPLESDESRR